jgi:hypothetical protein
MEKPAWVMPNRETSSAIAPIPLLGLRGSRLSMPRLPGAGGQDIVLHAPTFAVRLATDPAFVHHLGMLGPVDKPVQAPVRPEWLGRRDTRVPTGVTRR